MTYKVRTPISQANHLEIKADNASKFTFVPIKIELPKVIPFVFGDQMEELEFKYRDKVVKISLEKFFKILKEMEEQ